MADPYQVLGVKRDATADAIRKAYRRLAKQHHPDLNPGDKAAEAKFKQIQSAYDIVGDAAKRARFDRGEIDASGAETGPSQAEREYYRRYAERGGQGFRYQRAGAGAGGPDLEGLDLGGVFEDLFGERAGAGGAGRARGPRRGGDIAYTLTVDFADAVKGGTKRVVMADGKALDLTIPAGLQDGQTLRLRGQGRPGHEGAPAGDALVEVQVAPHPHIRREGRDLRSTLPVTLGEALGGGTVTAETLWGPVKLRIPKGANSGTVLRLRGKGVGAGRDGEPPAGDHLVELVVMLPESPDEALTRAVTEWEAAHPYRPRGSQGTRS
jgi:DnaJ-class molecular chaperone